MNGTHSRWHRICTLRKSIRNVFVMFKYGNWYAIATNSFRNSKFVIKYVHHANTKCKLRICQEYKSEVPVDNKDLCVMQISNMAWKFAVPTYLLSKSKFGNELAVFANWFAYFNIMNALWMHLHGLQMWHRLPWYWVVLLIEKEVIHILVGSEKGNLLLESWWILLLGVWVQRANRTQI